MDEVQRVFEELNFPSAPNLKAALQKRGIPFKAKEVEQLADVCPVVAGFGERDTSFVEHGRRLEGHLEALGIPHDVKIYPGVGHSYMNDHGSGPILSAILRVTPLHAAYDESAAEDSWRRMFEFFARHL